MYLFDKWKLTAQEQRDVYVRATGSFCAACAFGIVCWIIATRTNWFPRAWESLCLVIEIPIWLVLAATILVGLLLINPLRRLITPAYEIAYRSDDLNGSIWRWQYSHGKVTDLKPFCHQCDTEEILRIEGVLPPSYRRILVKRREQ